MATESQGLLMFQSDTLQYVKIQQGVTSSLQPHRTSGSFPATGTETRPTEQCPTYSEGMKVNDTYCVLKALLFSFKGTHPSLNLFSVTVHHNKANGTKH